MEKWNIFSSFILCRFVNLQWMFIIAIVPALHNWCQIHPVYSDVYLPFLMELCFHGTCTAPSLSLSLSRPLCLFLALARSVSLTLSLGLSVSFYCHSLFLSLTEPMFCSVLFCFFFLLLFRFHKFNSGSLVLLLGLLVRCFMCLCFRQFVVVQPDGLWGRALGAGSAENSCDAHRGFLTHEWSIKIIG